MVESENIKMGKLLLAIIVYEDEAELSTLSKAATPKPNSKVLVYMALLELMEDQYGLRLRHLEGSSSLALDKKAPNMALKSFWRSTLVPTWESYFIRYCKQLLDGTWNESRVLIQEMPIGYSKNQNQRHIGGKEDSDGSC